jgi:hypothetical protein
VSASEAETIQNALSFMSEYHVENNLPDSSIPPLIFSQNPNIIYAENEAKPNVHAVCELFGVAFTQG